MLSRFSLCGSQGLNKCVLKFQPASAITTSAANLTNVPPEFPPPGSKRDHVNFPRLICRETPPPVRLGFIPESWFLHFYPKTGYTGPYMLLAGGLIYLHSKEIIVIDHNTPHLYALIAILILVHNKYGDKIGEVYNKMYQEELQALDGGQEEEKQHLRKNIELMEGRKEMKDAIVEIGKARTEIVHLQMEVSYRERMLQVYKMVKARLDCQAELENIERRVAQKNVVSYVLKNVMDSITPELENATMQTCINDLNSLAARA